MWSSTLPTRGRIFLLGLAFVGLMNASLASGKVVAFLPQSFFFDWTPEGQVPPIPVTQQCQTIHVKWARSAAVGPNPSAPYYLQVYTSSDTTPFVISAGNDLSFDWQVPFAPGTQYQICMFDRNGNTGGCQATYTVIPSASNTTCANVTALPSLEAEGFVINGPWSKFGWIDQCTDLSIVPKNGTPPYTLTVAPSLHPPYNITSDTDKPLNWTVSLSWAMPFFVSVVDGTGQAWASGPLHAGGGPFSSTGCLSGHDVDKSSIKPYVAMSSGAGGLVFGLLVGSLVTWLFLRRSKRKKSNSAHLLGDSSNFDGMVRPTHFQGQDQYRPIPSTLSSSLSDSLTRGRGYQIEPFSMPDEEGRVYGGIASQSHASGYAPTLSAGPHHLTYDQELSSPPPPPPLPHNTLQPPQPTSPSRPNQVYVVHHDSQAPPVTIYHQEGTHIVELPPRYPPDSPMANASPPMHPDDLTITEGRSASGSEVRTETSRSNTLHTLSFHQPRHVGTIRKLPAPGTPQ